MAQRGPYDSLYSSYDLTAVVGRHFTTEASDTVNCCASIERTSLRVGVALPHLSMSYAIAEPVGHIRRVSLLIKAWGVNKPR